MREILFRGKSIITNEWVYGGIVHQTDFYGDIVDRYYIVDGTDTRDYDIGYSERVIPETVGQFTGLTDKNGIKIFEGDIVKGTFLGFPIPIEDDVFSICWQEDVAGYKANYFENVEVIGNIHDNPELLETNK